MGICVLQYMTEMYCEHTTCVHSFAHQGHSLDVIND